MTKRPWGALIRHWVARYGPAEVAGTAFAVLAAAAADALTGDTIVTAYSGAMGENIGFYSCMAWATWCVHRRDRATGPTAGAYVALLRSMVVEFGPAELLDTGLLRPLAMGLGVHLLGRDLGILAGKLLGDIFFYIPVIVVYELRRSNHLSK